MGTTSIGWALVKEAEEPGEQSSIVRLGVRVVPLTTDEQTDFEKGKSISTNAGRRLKRGMRRNLQRYKLRRAHLVDLLREHGLISTDDLLCEDGPGTTFETYRLRARAATEEISLSQLARVLLMINKKRGYKSNRKINDGDEGQAIDSMDVARELYETHQTPGQYAYGLLLKGRKRLPDFYPSDLKEEMRRIWEVQRDFHPECCFTDEFWEELLGKNERQTWAICSKNWPIKGGVSIGRSQRDKERLYQWRVHALEQEIGLEELAVVLQRINGQISGASGYLGAISDRSKELVIGHLTVGQYQMRVLKDNPNASLKNMVFYRQDYLDEFEQIWETQKTWHPELTEQLKREVRDVVIFYQRPLRSQKNLVGFCELESREREVVVEGKTKTVTMGLRACPKSSPLFQDFKVWQRLNDLRITGKVLVTRELTLFGEEETVSYGTRPLNAEERDLLAGVLCFRESLSEKEIKQLLASKVEVEKVNFPRIDGNHTLCKFYRIYQEILYRSGHGEHDFSRMAPDEVAEILTGVFGTLGIHADILSFDSTLEGKAFEKQPLFRLWHLLYSYTGDNSRTGKEKLVERIGKLCGMEPEYASLLADVTFDNDYGNLSAKAMRRILPYMKQGQDYSQACQSAGYRHSSRSLTKEEINARELKEELPLLRRNSLRNPVVEKILNQMVNVVNAVVKQYGRIDEVRIEMARELKKGAKERKEATDAIGEQEKKNREYAEVLRSEFHIAHPTRNDIVRYRLYLELESQGFKTLYSQTYIPREELFSKKFDIEHIVPQARFFDDSFANKTLESRDVNLKKADHTAFDFVCEEYGEAKAGEYELRVQSMLNEKKISKAKHDRLLMKQEQIPGGFIDRELRDSQYIARKAREMLEAIVRVVVPTTGSVTARLREDWQLVDVMKELNLPKYHRLGLTEESQDRDGRKVVRIKDWTKRNDHRHHAMDALTIAFTKPGFIQYLNNLNAKSDRSGSIYGIEQNETHRDEHGVRRFNAPMPLGKFRTEAKSQLEQILVSIKAKNKVVTRNVNKTKCKGERSGRVRTQLTPRGSLHNETIYGSSLRPVSKYGKVNGDFDAEKISTVTCTAYREALLRRLARYDGNAKKAFTGRHSLDAEPEYYDCEHRVPSKVKTVTYEQVYTIRKLVSPDLNVDKVVDCRVREILKQRLAEYGGDAKKAFANLDENPIWLNKEKGIAIKRVAIEGVRNAEPLHAKRDKRGLPVCGTDGRQVLSDYVSLSNNHHVAIFRDADGNLQERIVSFYEATAEAITGGSVVDKDFKAGEGWKFLFSMKQNEMFVFPDKEHGFDPKEVDLLNPDNYAVISPHLYRVQKLSSKYYVFRHHLETTLNDKKDLQGTTWRRITALKNLEGIVKVRVNHLGQIVAVGEY